VTGRLERNTKKEEEGKNRIVKRVRKTGPDARDRSRESDVNGGVQSNVDKPNREAG